MSKKLNSKSWRNDTRVYIHAIDNKPVVIAPARKRTQGKKSAAYRCDKYICTHKETGKRTCGIHFISNKRFCIGDDVWRLSQRSDFCEYPYRCFASIEIAQQDYILSVPPQTSAWIPGRKEKVAL